MCVCLSLYVDVKESRATVWYSRVKWFMGAMKDFCFGSFGKAWRDFGPCLKSASFPNPEWNWSFLWWFTNTYNREHLKNSILFAQLLVWNLRMSIGSSYQIWSDKDPSNDPIIRISYFLHRLCCLCMNQTQHQVKNSTFVFCKYNS